MGTLLFGDSLSFTGMLAAEQVVAHLAFADSSLKMTEVTTVRLDPAGPDVWKQRSDSRHRITAKDRFLLDNVASNEPEDVWDEAVTQLLVIEGPARLVPHCSESDLRAATMLIVHNGRLFFHPCVKAEITLRTNPGDTLVAPDQLVPGRQMMPYIDAPRWTLDPSSRLVRRHLENLERGEYWLRKLGESPFGAGALTLRELNALKGLLEWLYRTWLAGGREHLRFFGWSVWSTQRSPGYLANRHPTLGAWLDDAFLPSVTPRTIIAEWERLVKQASAPGEPAPIPISKASIERAESIGRAGQRVHEVIFYVMVALQEVLLAHFYTRVNDLTPSRLFGLQDIFRDMAVMQGLLAVAGLRPCSEIQGAPR